MKAGAMAWTPVALSSDLPEGGVLRTFVDGRDLAVWRSRSGDVRAWDNRCPHRGMRLSFGFVRGESLTCIYHGWQYGTDGVCRYIPAHPDLTPPKTLRTTAFTCVDKGGLIWASLSEKPNKLRLYIDDAEPLRSLVFDCSIAIVGSMVTKAGFPITEAWKTGEGRFTTNAGSAGSIIRDGRAGGAKRRLHVALQPLPDDRTAAHVLTSPVASSGLKIALSRWLERLRWFAENPDVETPSWRPTEAASEV